MAVSASFEASGTSPIGRWSLPARKILSSNVQMPTRALVLGGGGITGIAWETGVVAGLADAGVDLTTADLIVGTSAGSVVGALIASGVAVEDLYAHQLRDASGEIAARFGIVSLLRFVIASAWPGSDRSARARVGRLALAARTVAAAERVAVIRQRIGERPWPQGRLLIAAVDAETGETKLFDRESGVSLVEAVAASCAVPLVWPPVTIDGHHYVDGGVRSVTNVDLAAGCERVVVLAPITQALRRSARLSIQLAALGPRARSVVVTPDEVARRAIGGNVLDPAHAAASARAGRRQAAAVVEKIAAVWRAS